jgi:hypothetical protein
LPKLKLTHIVVSMAYITTADIAERYGLSRRQIGRLRESGELPYAEKIPGRTGVYLYDPDIVKRYFEGAAASNGGTSRGRDRAE